MKVNDSKKFTVLPPYDTVINPDVIYKIGSITSINRMNKDLLDPLTYVYLNVGLTENDYDKAIQRDIRIITLEVNVDKVIYVPEDYFVGGSNNLDYEVEERAMGINLGLLPKNFDSSFLEEEVKSLVNGIINNQVTAKTIITSTTVGVSSLEYEELTTRLKNGSLIECRSIVKQLKNAIDSLKIKLGAIRDGSS